MIHPRGRRRKRSQVGFYHFEDSGRRTLTGHGDGEFVRLHDEFGNVWMGQAERRDDTSIWYHFHSKEGRRISGISDGASVFLRDELGNVWRGFLV